MRWSPVDIHTQSSIVHWPVVITTFSNTNNHFFQSDSTRAIFKQEVTICICTWVLHFNYGVLGQCFLSVKTMKAGPNNTVPQTSCIYHYIVFLCNQVACFIFIIVALAI